MRVRTAPVRTGQVSLVRKVILEFSARPSGRANLSVQTEAVRALLGSVRTLKITAFFSKLSNDADFVPIRYLSKTL
jgi:hypothetical protein